MDKQLQLSKRAALLIALTLSIIVPAFADIKITDMPAATSVTGPEVFPIVQSGTNKKLSFTTEKSLWDSYYQPLDGDLTAISALSGTHTIYYRSGTSAWSAVTIGNGLSFISSTLSVSTPTPTPTATATNTPTPTATATPSATFTPTPTPTSVPILMEGSASQKISAMATATPSPTAAYVPFIDGNSVNKRSQVSSLSVGSAAALTTARNLWGQSFDGTANIGGAIELGTAGTTDTTLDRNSAGIPQVEGVAIPTISSTHTLTNKRVVPRTHSTSSATSWTPDFDTYDEEIQTALAGAVTINAPTYSSTNEGERRILRIKDNGTARAITWNGAYRAGTSIALPTTTTLSKTLYCGFMYNSTDSKWDLMAYTDGY